MPLALQALPATILLIGMLLANESPRYLAQQRPTAALHVLAQLRGLPVAHPYVAREMASINAQLDEERALSPDTSRLALLKEAFAVKSYRRRSVLCVSLMMWSNLTGTNAMTYYSPTIFASVGLAGASVGLLATGVYGIVKMVACGVFIVFVTDTLGRRRSLIWTGVAQVSVEGREALFFGINWLIVSGAGAVLRGVLHPLRPARCWVAGHGAWIRRHRGHLRLCGRLPVRLGVRRLDVLLCECSAPSAMAATRTDYAAGNPARAPPCTEHGHGNGKPVALQFRGGQGNTKHVCHAWEGRLRNVFFRRGMLFCHGGLCLAVRARDER